ncbi:hypothetical protein HON22_02750 [Candidatus Peregrinibacteria bacterium]|jgi:hypothetical protein|nr:hypothetical protein [Candidatus Peregrinibacteria bacterium]
MIKNNATLRVCPPSISSSGTLCRYSKNDGTQAVFEALTEKLKDLKAYENNILWTHADFRKMTLQTGVGMNAIVKVLKPISFSIHQGYCSEEDEGDRADEYFCIPNAGIVWQKFGKYLEIIVNDWQKLRGFINTHRGLEYSIYPHQVQAFENLTFNFTLDQIQRNGESIKNLGEKSGKLAKILLENRNCRFSYAELAKHLKEEILIQDYRSKYSYCRSLDKIFERLNRDCRTKIFHYKNDSVLVIEPCRPNVGDM